MVLAFVIAATLSAHAEGVRLYKDRHYAEAIQTLESAIKTEPPDSADYRESALLIGQSYFMLSKAPESIPWLSKLPDVNEANYMLGYAYLQAGQPAESERAFARLFKLKPESAAGHLLAAQLLLKKEYREAALSEIQKAVQLDPTLPEAHFILGEIEIAQGEFARAKDHLQRELEINPNFFMAWYRLGDVYAREQQWTEAISNLQRAVWLNQEYSGPLILLGKCYFETKSYSNAEGVLRRSLVIDPKNVSATYLLGRTLVAEGKTEEGKALLGRVAELRDPH